MATRKKAKSKAKSPKVKSKAPAKKGHNSSRRTATEKLVETGREYFVPCYKQRPVILDRAKGSRIWDLDGKDYIDFGAGIAVCSLGYGDKEMLRALNKQAAKLWHTSNIFFTEPPIRLAEELVKASKFASRVFFSNSGGEANEAAIKLARKFAADRGRPPEKRTIITFTGSFHGRTLTTVTATAQPKYQQGFEPLPAGFDYCPYNDFDAIAKRMARGDVCAILTECVQGEGGIMPAKPGFLQHLRALCDAHGALLMFDEVQDGMLRTGKLFSHWWEPGVKPDVVTLAKALGGGFPIGAMLVGDKAAETLQFGNHGTTFGGNPLAASIAHTVLKRLLSKQLEKNVAARSKQIISGLEKIGKKYDLFKEVRGRGLMIGAELNHSWHGRAGDFSESCRQHGVLVLQAGPNVLRCVPPLVITDKEVKMGLERARKGIAACLGK